MTSVPVCNYCGRIGYRVTPCQNMAVGNIHACDACLNGADPLEGMTQERWARIPSNVRSVIRDLSDLTPQLTGYEGWRVQVMRTDGTPARFIVGRSTGWKPCHIEVKRVDSSGGAGADRTYASVTPLRKVRG